MNKRKAKKDVFLRALLRRDRFNSLERFPGKEGGEFESHSLFPSLSLDRRVGDWRPTRRFQPLVGHMQLLSALDSAVDGGG